MLTPVQRSKMVNRFTWLDADGDGYVQESDFDLLVDRICESIIPPDREQDKEAVRKGYRLLWQHLVTHADADSDQRISQEEYLTAVEQGIMANPPNYDNSLGAALRALFRSLDTNGDGRIDKDEFMPLGSTFGVKPEQIPMIFEVLDADHDGEITMFEFLTASKDFYFGDNLESAGGKVFGR